jgi:hypothetical protein
MKKGADPRGSAGLNGQQFSYGENNEMKRLRSKVIGERRAGLVATSELHFV